ncbi:MAG: calcium-binding protein [Pseudomonadota bacterium]
MWDWFSVRDLIFGTTLYTPDLPGGVGDYESIEIFTEDGGYSFFSSGSITALFVGSGGTINPGSADKVVVTGDEGDILFFAGGVNQAIASGGRDYVALLSGALTFANGGDGHDTLSFEGFTEAVFLSFTRGEYSAADQTNRIIDFEEIRGSVQADILLGGSEGNVIDGGGGNDFVAGGGGLDVLTGRAGTNSALGGADYDYFFAEASSDTLNSGTGREDQLDYSEVETYVPVEVSGDLDFANQGVTTSLLQTPRALNRATASFTIPGIEEDATEDRLFNFEVFRGSGRDDEMIGNGTSRAYVGGGSDDILDNGASSFATSSLIVAGSGNDSVRAHSDDSLIFLGIGADTLEISGARNGGMDVVFDFDPSEDLIRLGAVDAELPRTFNEITTDALISDSSYQSALELAPKVISIPGLLKR